MKAKLFLLAAAIGLATTHQSHSALIINVTESGSDVVAAISGSIDDLTGATLSQAGAGAAQNRDIDPSQSLIDFNAPGGVLFYNNYDIPTLPVDFGTGTTRVSATSSTVTGGSFWFRNINSGLWIEENYVLGTAISGSNVYGSQSFASIGLTEGTYVWSWTGDSITVNIGNVGPSPVPEPGQVAASLLALGAIATHLVIKRRKAKRPATA